MEVLKSKINKEKDNGLKQIIEDIKDVERLLDINRKAYDDIEDNSLIEANIYEYTGLMIRYNYLLCLVKKNKKSLNSQTKSPTVKQTLDSERMEERV